ncbi:hypothetical protein [Paenibacillus sp. IHBB 10380]|uniref:hypothetical protein n=1 Tax=Paenibacillus sp. IHBB 10380 TaxID=1566358 RepID=UPI0005CFDF30|nr:hypothetical protein [Paenibacillus sp. IHBB 10380]AJS58661.1 hypothetical protein UB51_09385 [Paenibacillus sp. IHBB 10380]
MSAMDEQIFAMLYEAEKVETEELEGLSESLPVENAIEIIDITQPLVLVDGERMPFGRKELLDRKVSMILPKSFQVMNPQQVAIKYPSEHRPSLIYTNGAGSINLTFNCLDNPLTDEGLAGLTEDMSHILRFNLPIREWKGSGVRENAHGEQIGYSLYISSGLNANLYNEMGFAILEGKTLLCSFNCTEQEMKTWAPLFQSMMDSLQVIHGGTDA